MKHIPNKIFLNIGYEPEKGDDFNNLGEVTWCVDKVNDNDIEYQRKPIWHDLRKNPKDLPKHEGNLMAAAERGETVLYFIGYYLDGFNLDEYYKSSDNIIGWADIPKFKD